jgi:acetyl esterase/lipase
MVVWRQGFQRRSKVIVWLMICGVLSVPVLHPDAEAVLSRGSFDAQAVLAMDPVDLQHAVNAVKPPFCGIELALVEDRAVAVGAHSVPCRLYHPDPETRLPLVVWLHGGGWVLGSLDAADSACRLIAARGGVAVLSVDYRLAPQHPFPAAVDDCIGVTDWCLANAEALGVDGDRIAVGGDSAGGNLAAVVTAARTNSGQEPALAGQFLMYPAVDALSDTPSKSAFARGYMLEAGLMDWFYKAYAPDQSDWSDPRVSPLRGGPFEGLPPTIIQVAQVDVLRDEAVHYAVKLVEAGVDVDLLVAAGLLHGFAGMWTQSTAFQAEFEKGIDLLAATLHGHRVPPLEMLDTNLDGLLEPFEAADAIVRMAEEVDDDSVALIELDMSAALAPAWQRQELDEIWIEMNANGDPWLDVLEVDEALRPLADELDLDGDRRLSLSEFNTISSLEHDLFLEMEAASILSEYDSNGDDGIDRREAMSDPELHAEADADGDDVVSREELLAILKDWDASLQFEVVGREAHAFGTIDGTTPGRVMQLLLEHPEVRTIVLDDVPGSVDDDSSLRACRLIRHHRLSTHVPSDGEIASGGVDMFCAGVNRTADPGAMIGVHSWGGVAESGAAASKDDEAHQMYLEYGREMGLPDAFYWFTIEAAGPDDIHWMTREELSRFGVLTDDNSPGTDAPEPSAHGFDVQPVQRAESSLWREGFVKQAVVTAPNGLPIRIVAQQGVPDIVVARARNLLKFFLTDVPGSKYGADKAAVANAMADNRAMLMIPTGAHRPGHEPDVEAQPLFVDETPVDGSAWYLENDWDHRDAAFEEIFHLVHDAGIGTFLPGAVPEYQDALDSEARSAIRDGRWGIPIDPDVKVWLAELEEEGSLAQEYIACVIDSYYGLWASFDERPGGMWGIYIAKDRSALDTSDPRGRALVEAFLPPMMHGYEALIDPSFEGEFSLVFDPDSPYTHKSRYYVDATLTGDGDADLRGNDADNVLRGNSGDNTLVGGRGVDTAVFSGLREEYVVSVEGDAFVVTDTIPGRDGCDRLESIERIQFGNDEVVYVSSVPCLPSMNAMRCLDQRRSFQTRWYSRYWDEWGEGSMRSSTRTHDVMAS